jgi:hypothetical protein
MGKVIIIGKIDLDTGKVLWKKPKYKIVLERISNKIKEWHEKLESSQKAHDRKS